MAPDVKETILDGIEKGKTLDAIASDLHYSTKQTGRKISDCFGGVGFDLLRHVIFSPIVVHTIRSTPNSTAAATSLSMSSQALCNYTMRHLNSSPSKIKAEMKMKEVKEEKSVKEVLLIMAKMPDEKNVTLHELGVTSDFIKRMRKAGLPVISVPGRSGGYNLDRSSREVCRTWINNIRASRNLGPLTVLF